MLATPRLRFSAACAWGVVALGTAFWLLRDAIADKLLWALRQGDGDCVVNWLAARAFERGINPYSPDGLRWAGLRDLGHPPTTSLWYLPFTSYGIYDLNQVFGLLLILLLLVHFVLLAAELRAPVPLATALLGYALVMDTSWWREHVHMIQVSEPIAFLYLVAWIFLRRNHEIACGVVLGLALSIKPYAGLLVIMLLVGRRWAGAIAAAATWAVLALVVTVRFGFACWRQFLAMLPATQAFWTAHIRNASVQGIVARAWPTHAGAPPPLWAVALVAALVGVALVAVLAMATRGPLARKEPAPPIDDAIDLPFALFAVASAWLNPVVWEHYDVTLIQPIGVALFAAWRLDGRNRRAWAAAVTLALVAVALLLSIDMNTKSQLRIATTAHDRARLHAYEVANWLPWPLMLAVGGALLWRRGRSSPAQIVAHAGDARSKL
jgi:hypothetical protein